MDEKMCVVLRSFTKIPTFVSMMNYFENKGKTQQHKKAGMYSSPKAIS
jgi:small neutral amino acid transporter SnatA (MarC family)